MSFYVSTCQHVFCSECLLELPTKAGDCPICKTPTKLVQISKLRPNVAKVFKPVMPSAKAAVRSVHFQFQQAEQFVKLLNYLNASLKFEIEKNTQMSKMIRIELKSIRKRRRMSREFEFQRMLNPPPSLPDFRCENPLDSTFQDSD